MIWYNKSVVYFIKCQLTIIKRRHMHSSLSFTSNKDKTNSKKSDFRRDIIMPTIYSLQNYQFIKNNSFPSRPDRKVITAKKARLQSVVETIVSKKDVQVSRKPAFYKHRLQKPAAQSRRRSLPNFILSQPATLIIDIDERLNQKALLYEQSNFSQKEKIRQMKQKLKEVGNFAAPGFGQQEINFYITQVSPKKKVMKQVTQNIFVSTSSILTPQRIYKGYVEQQQQIEKRREMRNKKQVNTHPIMTVKPRPKTAGQKSNRQNRPQCISSQLIMNPKKILFHRNSLMNTKLSRFQQGSEVTQNIKLNNKNSASKSKFQNLINTIQSSCLENSLSKNNMVGDLNKLGIIWKTQKQLKEAQQNRTIVTLTSEALNMIKSVRKNQPSLLRLDEFVEQKLDSSETLNDRND